MRSLIIMELIQSDDSLSSKKYVIFEILEAFIDFTLTTSINLYQLLISLCWFDKRNSLNYFILIVGFVKFTVEQKIRLISRWILIFSL